MTQARRGWPGACVAALLCCLPAARSAGAELDPAHTRLGFQLSTRWGQKLDGLFVRYEGRVRKVDGGHQQVELRMHTAEVEIVGHPRYTQWARGEQFFEAARWPQVVFVSRPYAPELLRDGGELQGNLVIRGISRPETLTVAPSTCERPAYDCDVVATGAVRRSDFDMDDWKLAVNDRVVFVLRARVKDGSSE